MSNTANLKYTRIADLVQKARVDVRGKDPRNVYSRLPSMRQKSDEARKAGDDENAYIMLQRWLEMVDWIRKSADYKSNKTLYSANINIDKVQEKSDVYKINL